MTALAVLDQKLVLINRGRQALAEAKSIHDAKQIRDQAAAVEHYLKEQAGAADAALLAAELKLRAERRLGELLAKDGERRGRPAKNLPDVSFSKRKLPKGVSHAQSHRWQRVASVPEPKFEEHIETAKAKKERGELTTSSVIREQRRQENRDAVARASNECDTAFVSSKLEAFLGKKFGTIYADPPWQYSNQGTRASTDNHYETMTVDELAALPVKELAADKAHLWLWTTNGFLFECPRLFDAWGFEFKSSYIWVKPQIGIGNYLRNAHEFLLLAVRGGLTGASTNVRSWDQFDRVQHSAKPEQIRKRVVEQVSPGPRLEMFGRSPVDGWSVWGNQISKGMFDGDVREITA